MLDMTSAKRNDRDKGGIDQQIHCLRQLGKHDTFGIPFDKQYKSGEIQLGKCQHRAMYELGRYLVARGHLYQLDAGNSGILVATAVSDFIREHPAEDGG